MGIIYYIFKESIEESNQDKAYWMEKLAMMNKIGAALSDYLKELNDIIIENPGGCTEKTARYLVPVVKWMDVVTANKFRKNKISITRASLPTRARDT